MDLKNLGTIYQFTPNTICSISTASKKRRLPRGNRLSCYFNSSYSNNLLSSSLS